jgi:hypothetical protein
VDHAVCMGDECLQGVSRETERKRPLGRLRKLGFHKLLGNCLVCERLEASQEGFCSMELVRLEWGRATSGDEHTPETQST